MPVYKTQSEKTKDNKIWYFMVSYTDLLGNKKRYKSKKYATKEEAKKEEAKFRTKENEIILENSKITIYDVYEAYFFLDNAINKDSSLYTKESRIRTHVLPFFYDNKSKKYCSIDSITSDKINNWKKWLTETDFVSSKKNKDGTKIKMKLSLKTRQANYNTFSSIMRYAKEKYNLKVNPMMFTENFKEINDQIIENEPIRFITNEEYNLFINKVDKDFKTDFHFLYEVGCRKGEYQALTWEDVFFDKKQVRINKTLSTKNLSGGIKITNTKNRKVRYIDISDNLLDELKSLYNKMSVLEGFSSKWFVFGGIKYISSTKLSRIKDDAFDKLPDINRITVHEFRHSSASYMISNGIPAEIIAYRMGDTVETIRRVYAHLFPDTQKNAVSLFNKL